LRSDITRGTRDGRLPFRRPPLSVLDAFHAALAESFVLGHGTNLLDVLVDISGNKLAVSTHPALQIDTRVVVPDAPETRLDLCTVLSETLVLTTGGVERVLRVLQAHSFFWGAAWTTLCRPITRALRVAVQPVELLSGFGDG